MRTWNEHRSSSPLYNLSEKVLLRNDMNLLPLTPGVAIACIGPHCLTTEDLMGNYFEQRCADGSFDCVPTVSAGLAAINKEGTVSVTQASANIGVPLSLVA